MKRILDANNDVIDVSADNADENEITLRNVPHVPLWKTWGLRVFFAGFVFVLGKNQLMYILEGASEWAPWRGLGHSMLFALAFFAVGGLFRPLAFLPIMLYEIVWKATWLVVVALPPWLAGEQIPGVVSVKGSLIGICLIAVVIPWKYVWWRYFSLPVEPWRRNSKVRHTSQ